MRAMASGLLQRLPRACAVAAASLVVGLTAGLGSAGASAAQTSDPHITDSAVTTSGTGRFADLSVTVGKTQNLGNEAVKVAWRWGGADPGSHATVSDTAWNYNYMSVFQCWGDAPTGPTREQCQYGGQFGETDGINTKLPPFNFDPNKRFAVSRVVAPVDILGRPIAETADPLEATDPAGYPAVDRKPGVVPMHAAPTGAVPEGERLASIETGQFFDKYGTNEVPLARTNGDGSGEVFFEAQTVFESQFLGCGARIDTGSDGVDEGRSCWLVVVPRDAIDANGQDVRQRVGGSTRALYSSPLSLSNWQNRIVVPLGFEPVREPCRLGGVERPVVGHESLSVAMSSWQGPLCSGGQGYFYATTTDDIARQTVTSDLPKLSVITEPLEPDAVPADRGGAVYAPVAASGVSISLFVERLYNSASSAQNRPYNGTRVEQIRLTPRLVAKLLTQSYRYSTWINGGGPTHLSDAPLSLLDDPEFKEINDFSELSLDVVSLRNQRESLAKIFVTADSSDAVRLVWEWVLGDESARAFLSGEPDHHGMTVNSFFKGIETYEQLSLPRADIPRLDPSCVDVQIGTGTGTQPLCALDAAPYVNSFDHGAALTARGQQLGGGSFVLDTSCNCVKMPRPDPQLVGQRALITLTDTPSSARRGLIAASLQNTDGGFVAPTTATMTSALDQAVDTAVSDVKRVDPNSIKGNGYPLTRLSYAVTNPALLDQDARDDYAGFLELVATDGQRPGTGPGNLPIGYAPLPRAMQAQALKAAEAIRTATAPKAATTDGAGTTSTDDTSSTGIGEAFDTAPVGATLDTPGLDGLVDAGPPGVDDDAALQALVAQRASAVTGGGANIPISLLLPILAGLGLLAGLAGRLMLRLPARANRG